MERERWRDGNAQKADFFCQTYAEVSRVERRPEDKEINRAALNGHRDPCECRDGTCGPFTMTNLNTAIKSLKVGKAPGADEVSNEMLKHLGPNARCRLLQLVNRSLEAKEVPSAWKKSIIIPVHKKGKSKEDSGSYQPVALTSCITKLLVRMVVTRIVYLLESKKILSPYQAGFRKNRCTEEQIVRIVQDAFDGLEEKKPKTSVMTLMDSAERTTEYGKCALPEDAEIRNPNLLDKMDKSFLGRPTRTSTVE